ncbi:helix-turn-helix transcriptional regulator [Rhizobium bangladeshense]|uniref:helix-turn-helix domain-containing protein n=1 Tax=Rhizobium bangladeshense TaxID=1138189 RepID=UPI001A984715|nr:helix-turn-helix transcriptional regulator [Rhizobium bangladeshense]QSY96050.1 helix-turn-helix transcriptional regulator [Rhizobium bangladeshense]
MTDDVEDVGRKAALSIFGDIIKRKRQSCQWTFYGLSEKTGIDIADLSDLEQGHDAVSEAEREELCGFLGVDIDCFAKILRRERAKSEMVARLEHDLGDASVVDLARYREWQKTTSPQAD